MEEDIASGPPEHSRRDWCPVQRDYLSGTDPALPSCPKCGGWFATELSATTTTEGTGLDDRISKLDVNDKWKERFRSIVRLRRATGGRQADFRKADAEVRKAAFSFNVLAFLFGFVYYFFKGMHRRGLVGLGGAFLYVAAASWVEAALDVTFPLTVFWIPGSAVAVALVNADFFDTRIEGLQMWPALKRFDNWVASGLATLVGLVVLVLVTYSVAQVTVSDIEAVLDRDIRDQLALELVDVACPDDAPVRKGSTFVCILSVERELIPIEVTMTSDTELLWSVADTLVLSGD